MPLAIGLIEPFHQESHPVVFDFDHDALVLAPAADDDGADADLAGEAVLDRVLDQRLQDHARHDDVDGVGTDLLAHAQLRSELDDLDVEVLVDRLELLRGSVTKCSWLRSSRRSRALTAC